MPSLDIVMLFGAVCIAAAAMPGPDFFYVSSQAITRGFRSGAIAACGIVTGLAIHVSLAAAGLTAVFATSATAFEIVRWLGVAYLLYLAFRVLTAGDGDEPAACEDRRAGLSRIYLEGALTNLLNPKAILFFLALLPQFVRPANGHIALQVGILGGELMLAALVVFLALAYAGAMARERVLRSALARRARKWLFGGLLGGAAVWLALSARR